MKTIQLNKQTWHNVLARTRRLVLALPYIVLVERFMMVRFILLMTLSVIALLAVISLLYLWGEGGVQLTEDTSFMLNVESVDQLELWLEERQTERETTIVSGGREYFKR